MEFEEKVKLLRKARAYWIWGLVLTLLPVGFVLRYLAVRLVAKVMNNDEISRYYGSGLLFCFIPFLSILSVTGELWKIGEELGNDSLCAAAVLYSFSANVLAIAAVLFLFGWGVCSIAIGNWSMLIGLVGFGSLLWGLVYEAQGVWHLHEISHETPRRTSGSRVRKVCDIDSYLAWRRVVEIEGLGACIMKMASPTRLFIIFLFIWILVMGLGDSEILRKIFQQEIQEGTGTNWADVIGIVGIIFSGFLSFMGVGGREKRLREECEREWKRKMREDYERRCRRWGKYWGMPGLVLFVLRLKDRVTWRKGEIIETVIKTLKEGMDDPKEEFREKFGRFYKEELDKMESALERKNEVIPWIESALKELIIEGLLVEVSGGESYELPLFEEYLSPFSESSLFEYVYSRW
jgi:uncharacterized membrane protein